MVAKSGVARRAETPEQSLKAEPAGRRAAELDRLIHERVRLGIVSALAVNAALSFNELKGLLKATDGNLSVHARKLEAAQYIMCTKSFQGRIPKTEYRLTAAGRRALERYLDHMEALIRAARHGRRRRRARYRGRPRAPPAARGRLLGARGHPRGPDPARRRPADPHRRRAAALRFPAVGVRLRRALLHRHDVARLRRGRPRRRRGGIPLPGAPLRRATGRGGRMSALSEKTRLGLEILGPAAPLPIAGDTLLRATPWGLNAFVCTATLVAATAWIVRRGGIAAGGDAPWLAGAALVLRSPFLARGSGALRAVDGPGLAILFSVAGLSLRGATLRGRYAWDYLVAGVTATASACIGVLPLVARDVRWSELPSGGGAPYSQGGPRGAAARVPPPPALRWPFAPLPPL